MEEFRKKSANQSQTPVNDTSLSKHGRKRFHLSIAWNFLSSHFTPESNALLAFVGIYLFILSEWAPLSAVLLWFCE